jgi:hypothetical protein
VKAIAKADPVMHVWWGTRVECVSAMSRLERLERRIDMEQVGVALRRLEKIAGDWTEIGATESVRLQAQRLLRVHDLRAGDAFQLAAALTACEGYPSTADFICLDNRLSLAAMREGFRVASPGPETKS